MSMNKELWIPTLVGAIILGTLGWLAVTVFQMNSTLSKVEIRWTETSARVDRIASAIPSWAIQVASEELVRPITTAVVSTKPVQLDSGEWKIAIHIIDVDGSMKTTFELPVKGQGDREPLYTLLGTAAYNEPDPATVANISAWCVQTNDPHQIPAFVDGNATFVLRSTSATDILKKLPWLHSQAKETKLTTSVGDCKGFLGLIKSRQDDFKVTQ